MKKFFFNICALLTASAAFVACSSDNYIAAEATDVPTPQPHVFSMMVNASKGGEMTRALTLNNSTLIPTWNSDEEDDDVVWATSDKIENASGAWLYPQYDGVETSLYVDEMEGNFEVGDQFFLELHGSYPFYAINYAKQYGTLETIAYIFDYCTATATITDITDNTITANNGSGEPVVFEPQQAIVRFTLVDQTGEKLSASKLVVSADGLVQSISDYVLPPTYGPVTIIPEDDATDVIFAALRGVHSDLKLTATVGDDTYVFKKSSGVEFKNGKYYEVKVKMKKYVWEGDLSEVKENTTLVDGTTITGTLNSNVKLSVADNATVTLNNVNIRKDGDWAGLTCEGDAVIILQDGSENTVVTGNEGYPGIFVPEGHTLTIKGGGTLHAFGYEGGAGIGAGEGFNCGDIVIESGTIDAHGGDWAAGIGSGDEESVCGAITIKGGIVTAIGSGGGAGIGSGDGSNASCGTITINDGQVTVEMTDTEGGAAIGSGSGASCSDIIINGGTVIAKGCDNAAGIGSGKSASCQNITISGGTVTATGGSYAAGIGTGTNGSCMDIHITDEVIKVIANKGTGNVKSIGEGKNGTCNSVTIDTNAQVTEN